MGAVDLPVMMCIFFSVDVPQVTPLIPEFSRDAGKCQSGLSGVSWDTDTSFGSDNDVSLKVPKNSRRCVE